MRNPALFARVFNTPLMIHSMKLDAIIAGIGQRFGIETPQIDMALTASGEKKRPGYEVIGNVAVIDVFGVLAHRGGVQADSSFIMGYDKIAKTIDAAINDTLVKGILLQMDSPGGEVSGAFELAQQIREAGAIKPIKAAISSLAASAGYLIASAAQEISITDTGIAGSIGVVMRHVDISQMAADDGVLVTHIFAGAQKVDGNQFEPLSPETKARFQSEIDTLYTLFVSTVSQYRGLDANTIRAQEAGVFTGQDAIKAGLADRIATPDQMLADMQQSFSHSTRGISMGDPTKEAVDAAALEQSRVAGYEAGKQEGITVGASAERERISAILNHEHAKGREAQATVLALQTDMSIEQAGKVLAVSPVQQAAAEAGSNQFAEMMATIKNPAVGADGEPEDETDSDAAETAKVVALFKPQRRG